MHIMYYVDTIKITKYLKVLQHVSDHTGSIISSGVPRGGGWGVQTPPEILKALQNRAKLNPTVKTV